MFTVAQRERVQARILELAGQDERVVAAAIVGGGAHGGGDEFSDLDLAFAVAEGHTPAELLDDLTPRFVAELDAAHLFDLPAGGALYRVLLLPGCLQVDVSAAPAAAFGARGPSFELLFGEAHELASAPAPDDGQAFGLAVHHAVRAYFCIRRGRRWQAEFWLSGVRDEALALACRRHGLESAYARGADRLPPEVLAPFETALPRTFATEELLRALRAATECLLREAGDRAAQVGPWLRELLA